MTIVEEAIARHAAGIRIAELRTARGMSQRVLAARAGLSQGHVANIERGHSRASDETRRALAEALGVDVEALAVTS